MISCQGGFTWKGRNAILRAGRNISLIPGSDQVRVEIAILNSMESRSLKLPEIPSSEQTPLVQRLLQIIVEQQKRIEELEEEVLRLKRETVKPKIKPSRLEQGRTSQEEAGESGRRRPGPKRSKTPTLEIHHTEIVKAEEVPASSVFKGYQD